MSQQDTNEQFFERADAHINLANQQTLTADRGRVGASMMIAAARFSAWLAAHRFQSAERLRAGKQETMQHFMQQFQQMLDDNIEDHIRQFEQKASKP